MQDDCAQRCNHAKEQGTTLAMVNYCKIRFDDKEPFKSFDFTGSGRIGDYDDELLAGLGVCEDAIYCPTFYECRVGTKLLTMSNCINILCDYFMEQRDLEFAEEKITELIVPGDCFEGQKHHWYYLEFGEKAPKCG